MEVEMRIRGLLLDPVTNTPIVILKDANSDTVLPIWVGVYEANAIARALECKARLLHAPESALGPAAGIGRYPGVATQENM